MRKMKLSLLLFLHLLLPDCDAFLPLLDRCPRESASLGATPNEKKMLTPADALALQKQADALRAEARSLELALKESKEEKARKEAEKVDSLIDQILVSFSIDDSTQMLNTEEQVAQLMQDKRLSADHVNKIFDRICEKSQRRQSIENCSPLISLLLDAACKVDCLEREENPNKRWNHRVERDLRKKLFAMGWGIDLEDVKSKDRIRSLTGEKDIY
uniref:Uncharacterized protein n=1 Tax=Trieres chinensis TaxID=1514140 RepID=A0A7S1ZWG2_TRICV|mmetsp:Transcript_34423/g.70303  ORF Transcript_34423/g.70303 Transcript_34423/m.70303 type:complete len:215 (+) Transcript_34423:111-755(+)